MSDQPIKQELKPDHGENFVPGSETAPDHMAPQPLDHFKRGYKERADLRNRETNQLKNDMEGSQVDQDSALPPPVDNKPPSRETHHRETHHRETHHRETHHRVTQHRETQHRETQYRETQYRETQPVENDHDESHRRVSYHREPPNRVSSHREPYYREQSCYGGQSNKECRRGSTGFDATRVVDELCTPGCHIFEIMDRAKERFCASFQSGKALTAILSNLARRRKMGIALSVWQWMDQRQVDKNVFHYNSLISVCEKTKDNKMALQLLGEMERRGIKKNEVTFSSAISACEKAGQWRVALELLDRMKKEGVGRTAIAYNAAISACEKGLVPHKALELFEQMKREGVSPTVITYSALISAAEKGQQWKLALEVLEEMKASGHGANVIAYSAAISALSKGQMWEKALELFRELESSGNTPSIVTYNATMTALEKGLQWERALDLFDEMKVKGLQITVVSYGSAISACEKGLQYRQCLEYLDEMTELGIKKNVIIFGAAMSCMEKCCRADIAFQLMDRMKMEGVAPNVHIYNSAISACARCGLWEKGLGLFEEMEKVGVVRDVVSFNAVLDAVSSQVRLGRRLFELGIEKGFYARVSRLGTQWLELDLHFLSLGGGEIALGWWFEECLVPYLVNTSRLEAVKSIDIVTGYGKTRMRGIRHGDDGMRKRVRAMLRFMAIEEVEQPNKGRIHIDKDALIQEVKKNGGRIIFDEDGYRKFKEQNTTANHVPDVSQKVRPRFSGPLPATDTSNDYRRSSFQGGGNDRRTIQQNSRRPGSSNHYDRRVSSNPYFYQQHDIRSSFAGQRGGVNDTSGTENCRENLEDRQSRRHDNTLSGDEGNNGSEHFNTRLRHDKTDQHASLNQAPHEDKVRGTSGYRDDLDDFQGRRPSHDYLGGSRPGHGTSRDRRSNDLSENRGRHVISERQPHENNQYGQPRRNTYCNDRAHESQSGSSRPYNAPTGSEMQNKGHYDSNHHRNGFDNESYSRIQLNDPGKEDHIHSHRDLLVSSREHKHGSHVNDSYLTDRIQHDNIARQHNPMNHDSYQSDRRNTHMNDTYNDRRNNEVMDRYAERRRNHFAEPPEIGEYQNQRNGSRELDRSSHRNSVDGVASSAVDGFSTTSDRKRPLDRGEQPVSKRRGYEIDASRSSNRRGF